MVYRRSDSDHDTYSWQDELEDLHLPLQHTLLLHVDFRRIGDVSPSLRLT